MRIAIGVVLLAMIGCGGGAGTDADRLQGTWGLETPSTDLCALILVFQGSQYEAGFICELTDGSYGLETEAGAFTASGGTLRTTATHSSCALTAAQLTQQGTYSFVGNNLRIMFPSSVLVLTRITPTGGGGTAAAYGCYDDQGYFVPRPVTPVP